MKLEIIGFNVESCIVAQQAGANRIELCDNPTEGGTTPSYGFIKAARKKLSIELYVMIRPRGGDFLYTKNEFEIMKSDIELCKQTGCDGIVTGILQKDGSIDKERTLQLVEYAYPLGVTFHRAFDNAKNPLQALEDIIATGSERILTSGQQIKAIDGIPLIKQLIEKAEDRIIIMPGAGIKAENINTIAENTGAVEFHSSASIKVESRMEYHNTNLDRMDHIMANKDEVTQMVFNLKKNSK